MKIEKHQMSTKKKKEKKERKAQRTQKQLNGKLISQAMGKESEDQWDG